VNGEAVFAGLLPGPQSAQSADARDRAAEVDAFHAFAKDRLQTEGIGAGNINVLSAFIGGRIDF